MDLKLTSTTNDIHGYHIVRQLGVVRGVTVRARGWIGQFAAGLRTIGGGKIHEYVALCEETRGEAFDLMIQHAEKLGAKRHRGSPLRRDRTGRKHDRSAGLRHGGGRGSRAIGSARASPRLSALLWNGDRDG